MLSFRVVNMSCGHCQLKIDAALKEENYVVEKIDMDKSIVTVQATLTDKLKISVLLDQIGYLVDQDSFKELTQHVIRSTKLDKEELFDEVISYLAEKDYLVEDVTDDLSIVVLCSEREFSEVGQFIETL